MRQTVILFVLLLQAAFIFAQKSKRLQFDSYNAGGIIAGKSPVALTLQTVNGVSFNKWFVGAGFGIDYYNQKSLPLFASVRRDVTMQKFHFFLYADGGTHFLINPQNRNEGLYSYKTTGKLYLEAGAGIKLITGRNSSIFFTAGNSYKNITAIEQYPDSYKNVTDYKLGRISVRAGFQF